MKKILNVISSSTFLLVTSLFVVKSVEAKELTYLDAGSTTYVCTGSPNESENGGKCRTLSSGNGTMCFTFGSGPACSGTVAITQ